MFNRFLAPLALVYAVPLAAQDAPDPAFVGHYYLSGVMETGSELLLKPDGRFEWFLAYGALDQFAKGRWTRRGDTIALIADVPDRSRPLFALDAQQPWNAKAEAALREAEEDERRRAIEAKCPFLHDVFVTTTAAIPMPGDKPAENAKAKASAALLIAVERRGEAERAMAAAMTDPSDAANATASEALVRWQTARSEAFHAHNSAGLEMETLADPRTPGACASPPYTPADVSSPLAWRRGVAVVVGDPEKGTRFASIDVTFHLADGHDVGAVTDPGGWAIAPKAAAPVVAVSLAFAEARPPLASGRMAMTPLTDGIQPVRIDIDQLTSVPFKTFELKIDGRNLLPERGRYSRD